MGSVTHPRGRLPRRVYWVRRLVVLGVALALVFGIGKLLGGNGRDQGSAIEASNSASTARQTPGQQVTMGPVAPSRKVRLHVKGPLLPPSGECRDDEVSVLPSVPRAWAGSNIVVRLRLQGTQPACTFKVSPDSMVVKITSGNDRIWSSQDCPKAIPTTQVVVRSGQPVTVPVTWNGRRSDTDCPKGTGWALPGFYHVYAAAYGSTPTDVQFEITHAATRVVTKTPKPKPRPTTSPSASPSGTSSSRPKASPKAKPTSGSSVSGKQTKCGGDIAAGSC